MLISRTLRLCVILTMESQVCISPRLANPREASRLVASQERSGKSGEVPSLPRSATTAHDITGSSCDDERSGVIRPGLGGRREHANPANPFTARPGRNEGTSGKSMLCFFKVLFGLLFASAVNAMSTSLNPSKCRYEKRRKRSVAQTIIFTFHSRISTFAFDSSS